MSQPAGTDTHARSPGGARQDAAQARRIVAEYARRRAAGETISDAEILRAHEGLAAFVEQELALLRIMKRAASHAEDSNNGSSSTRDAGERPLLRPDAIPGYSLIREIHRGGQGVVYEAEQESTHRRVAIKLLHRGPLASSSDRSRFVREVALLVRLRHPNIVAVHDTGRVGNSHYIVMDLISGAPLDQHVETRRAARWPRATLTQVVTLLADICDAVHAAHLRGIIHRDLKPGNILIDAAATPHILDFGLAKDVGDADSDLTNDGQFIGSVPWASPEQVSGAADVDIRTDVYSLGVILFESLTGRFPYPVSGPVADIFAAIRTAEPMRPRSLRTELSAELESIVLKCLSKDPARRYESAGQIARDLRRYLSGEPIEARRDSTMYVLSKYLRRYRRGVFAAGLVLFGVAAFAVYAAIQAEQQRTLAKREFDARIAAQDAQGEAQRQQIVAAKERDDARRARDAEALERDRAEAQARRAASVTAFLIETIGQANPDVSQNASTTMVSMLDAATEEIDRRFAAEPQAEAAVRAAIGQAFASLGELEPAEENLARAIELHDTVLSSPDELVYPVLAPYVSVLEDMGDYRWRSFWRRLWRMFPALLAPEDEALRATITEFRDLLGGNYDADRAEALWEVIYSRARTDFAPDDARWLILAELLCRGGANLALQRTPADGCRYLTAALAIQRDQLPETHSRVVRTLGTLMTQLIADGQFVQARAIARQSLASLETVLPADHWLIAVYRAREGACLSALGDADSGEQAMRAGITRIETISGVVSYKREIYGYLAQHFARLGRAADADAWRTRALELLSGAQQDFLPAQVKSVLDSDCKAFSDALAQLREAAGDRAADIRPRIEAALTALPDSPHQPIYASILAETLWAVGKTYYDHATRFEPNSRRAFQEAVNCYRRSRGLHPYKAGRALFWYGYSLDRQEKYVEAERALRESLPLFDLSVSRQAGTEMCARSVLGEVVAHQGRLEEGERLLVDAYHDLRNHASLRSGDRAAALTLLLRHYERRQMYDPYLDAVLIDLREILPRQDTTSSRLEQAAWRIAKYENFPAAAYDLARAAAVLAAAREPENAVYRRTAGAALYRSHLYPEAVAELRRADKLHAAGKEGRQPIALALLCMANHAAGDDDAAREAFDAARPLMAQRRFQTSGNRRWFQRAAAALGIDPAVAPEAASQPGDE